MSSNGSKSISSLSSSGGSFSSPLDEAIRPRWGITGLNPITPTSEHAPILSVLSESSDSSSSSNSSSYAVESELRAQLFSPEQQEVFMNHDDLMFAEEMQQEIRVLKERISTKDIEILELKEQLHRAVESKNGLLAANEELELEHALLVRSHEKRERDLKKATHSFEEMRALAEKEFINELVALTEKMNQMETKHQNELLERDFQVAMLQEQLRRNAES